MSNIPFVFFGTPHFAVRVLEELEKGGLVPELIITAPDKPVGRGLALTPPAVKTWAIEHNIPYIQPESLKELPAELTQKEWPIFIVAAYGKILRKKILELPEKGCINLHPSLLPRFRGASPIESQILADEQPIGVSVMRMDAEMDHGDILAQEIVDVPNWPIDRQELAELLVTKNAALAARVIPEYLAGSIAPMPQDHSKATYTEKITKADGEINLSAPARQNYLKYLAYLGWPGTYFFAERNGKRLRVKITKASLSAGSDQFVIERVIPEGKPEQLFEQFNAAL